MLVDSGATHTHLPRSLFDARLAAPIGETVLGDGRRMPHTVMRAHFLVDGETLAADAHVSTEGQEDHGVFGIDLIRRLELADGQMTVTLAQSDAAARPPRDRIDAVLARLDDRLALPPCNCDAHLRGTLRRE